MMLFKLPDLGEGLPDAEIVQWHIKEGDIVKTDQPIVSMETAKAIVEVPSPYCGRIVKLYGQPGDVILTGNPLVEFERVEGLIEKTQEKRLDTGTVVGKVEVGNEVFSEAPTSVGGTLAGVKVLPAVRALAKKLNVDLTRIIPTGQNGMITQEDVKQAQMILSDAGPMELLHGVRRAMALAMQQSHAQVVPVSLFDEADITEWTGENKDYTVRLLQAIVYACQQEPALNAWYDGTALGRRLLKKIHIGIAMDTPEGLFVPVLHNSQDKTASEFRQAVDQLKSQVLNRSILPDQLRGGSITLSNFGKFAGYYASPIVMPPTVSILGVGSVREVVRPVNGQVSIRMVLPLSLSFDHRAVTGGEATRFLGFVMGHLAKK